MTARTSLAAVDSSLKYKKKGKPPKKKHPETLEKSGTAKRLSPPIMDSSVSDETVMKFKMPDFMQHHLKNSAEFMFNPIPNLLTFEVPLSYSEFNADFNMCPVPRFPKQNSLTQKKFLDKNDVIRGLMTWRKMPSPTLLALISNPTLREFRPLKQSEYILAKPPPLLKELPEEAKELAASGTTNPIQMRCNMNIVPTIVEENFVLPSEDQNTDCRSYIENDLNKRIQYEKNQLGKKIRERISNLIGLLSDDTLLCS
ncbi:cilia- and flagella-associated protein 221-like [Octopus sinensis]|uniref:Cilia- and flagella-associated protein 221-like n=1 Tax=Octopus sinensis TaxID=2607531 RepID=A0A6P7TPV5_9MOLL|nr:cilia- and flagella-associated protein 221-like [Octopus sinensis]